jgi:hypothetical protein
MKIAVMQPYFFPYMGYFGLIKHTDKWIVFDTSQFRDRGWMKRNRILRPKSGWQYFRVITVKHPRNTKIQDIKIKIDDYFKDKLFSKLTVYKRIAPFYKETVNVLEKCLSIKTDSISLLNCHAIKEICNYIEIEWNYTLFSEMNLNIEKVEEPDDWALNICRKLGNVEEYWNLPGGIKIYNPGKFEKYNIELKFFNQILKPYNQKRTEFEPGLSIIDVMMFNSRKEIIKQLDNYSFLKKI